MAFSRSLKHPLRHLIGWFSTLRLYNLLVLTFTLCTVRACFESPISNWWEVFLNRAFIGIFLASFFSVSAGHIINDFYDAETDLVNHPLYVKSKYWVSQKNKFQYYFLSNLCAVGSGIWVSWRIGLFFGGFIFLIWFYSHKIKKFPIPSLLVGALLPTIPMMAILLYFHYNNMLIWNYAILVYLLLLILGLLKNLINLRGDIYYRKNTIAIQHGIRKVNISIVIAASIIVVVGFLQLAFSQLPLGLYWFIISLIISCFLSPLLLMGVKSYFFKRTYFFVKLLILAGVYSIWWCR